MRNSLTASAIVLATLASPVLLPAGRASAEPVVGLAPAGAEAEGTLGQRLLEAGLLRYEAADYEQAIELFRVAYDQTRSPALLFNLAQAYRLKGDCDKAIDLYRRFNQTNPQPTMRDRAQSWIAGLKDCPRREARPALTADRREAAPSEPAADIARAGVLAAPDPPPLRERHFGARVSGVVLVGVALLLGATSAYFAARASSDSAQISGLFQRGGAWDEHAAAVDADGRWATSTAGTLAIGAGATLLVGAAAYGYGWLGDRRGLGW